MVDPELMDMLSLDLKDAVHGLPVTFKAVPFDTPIFLVYVNDVNIGSLIYQEVWHALFVLDNAGVIHIMGREPRAALARLLNDYIDKRVGLI